MLHTFSYEQIQSEQCNVKYVHEENCYSLYYSSLVLRLIFEQKILCNPDMQSQYRYDSEKLCLKISFPRVAEILHFLPKRLHLQVSAVCSCIHQDLLKQIILISVNFCINDFSLDLGLAGQRSYNSAKYSQSIFEIALQF